jgi:hypothetical protein
MVREPAILALLAICSACATRPGALPVVPGARVLVKSAHLPSGEPWYSRWADHMWFDVCSGGQWWRVEVLGPGSGVRVQQIDEARAFADVRWGREAHILADVSGGGAETKARAILERAPGYPFDGEYEAWPGPNSNTFVVWVSREVGGLDFDPYPTAVGRNHRGWFGLGSNPGGDGFEITTPLVGVEAGPLHGLDLHFLAWTVGVGLWPPTLRLPFLRGIPGGWLSSAEARDAEAHPGPRAAGK